ncbi:two-component system sensor kinase [Actinomycetales bacterium JB111]|nr:two-component system sensor kinase [Actinomycetales bacterium JB111]
MQITQRPAGAQQGLSLTARLVAATILLLATGLAMAGIAVITVLRTQLIAQMDDNLAVTVDTLADSDLVEIEGEVDQLVPTRYAITIQVDGLSDRTRAHPNTEATVGLPIIEEATLDGPVTVAGSHPGVAWRALSIAIVSTATGEKVGTLTISSPLDQVSATMQQTGKYVVLISVTLVVLGATIGFLAIRRELRDLKSIERTAGAIAAGDLTRRVAPGPPGTEIGSLADSLNAMLAQIEIAFEARSASERRMRRFVADASHELRTPLATVRGYAELHRIGGVPESEVPAAMGRIEAEATRMGSLVEDLLTLARIDEQRQIVLSPVDVRNLADDAIRDLRALDPSRPAALAPLPDSPGPTIVHADADQLRQVFANLVGNAVRHTPPGTPVEILVGFRRGAFAATPTPPATQSGAAPSAPHAPQQPGPGWGQPSIAASAPSGPHAGPVPGSSPAAGPSAAGSPAAGSPAAGSPAAGSPGADSEDLDQTLTRSRWAAVGQLESEEVGDTTVPNTEPTPAGPRSRTARRIPDRSILGLFTGRHGRQAETDPPDGDADEVSSSPRADGRVGDDGAADSREACARETDTRADEDTGGGHEATTRDDVRASGPEPIGSGSADDVALTVRREPGDASGGGSDADPDDTSGDGTDPTDEPDAPEQGDEPSDGPHAPDRGDKEAGTASAGVDSVAGPAGATDASGSAGAAGQGDSARVLPADFRTAPPSAPLTVDAVVVRVQDHGPGIPPDEARKVFTRFYRVDQSRARASGGGSGLGLAIVASVAESHGGRADVLFTPGGGTTVEFMVPVAGPPLAATMRTTSETRPRAV